MVVLRSIIGRHSAAVSMERVRGSDVEQQHVADVAEQHAALNGRAPRHNLVRIDALVCLLAGELVSGFDDPGHAGHAAYENELVNVGLGKAGVFEARLKGLYGLFNERIGELFELPSA